MASIMNKVANVAGSINNAVATVAGEHPNPLYRVDGNGAPNYVTHMSVLNQEKYDVETQLIRGTMSFSKDKLKELDPSYTGYTHIFVLRMPPFMTQVANGRVVTGYESDIVDKARTHCKNLKALIEMGSTSYSGTPDLTLNTSEVNTGFSERSYPAPTYSAYDSKTFNLNVLETRGDKLRHAVEFYINGVSDANVKATMLHGALNDDGSLMEPTLANMTFAFMIVQTDQTLLNIQDISLWNSCIITSIDRSTLDWDNGTIDIVQPRTLAITGNYMPDSENAYLRAMAEKLLGYRLSYYKRYQDMDSTTIGAKSWSNNAY